MLQLILESLDKNRLEIFQRIKAFKNIGVLGGGTALSLQIGHRVSYDFDIFTKNRFPNNLRRMIKNTLGTNYKVLLDYEDQLDLTTTSGVKVTFFYDDYKLISKPIKTPYIDLMNLDDIAATKAYIIGRRPKWRDYVDIYFLLNEKYFTLAKIIELFERKYGAEYSKRLFLQQLVYWKDITDYTIKFLKTPISPERIKSFLAREVSKYRKNEL